MPHEPLHPTHGRHAAVPVSPRRTPHLHRAGPARPARARPVPLAPTRQGASPAGAHRHVLTRSTPAWGIVTLSLALTAALSLPSTAAAHAEEITASGAHVPAQSFLVAGYVHSAQLGHDGLTAEAGNIVITFSTNADWARLVLVDGGWPLTQENVDFMLRWMRQENGPQNWWNRNNPLNNGYGSGGGAGFGSYDNLKDAAHYVAANLQRGYPAVVQALKAGTSADRTAQAIWASPWASSHYAYGAHWSSAPVPIVAAPALAW
ncbi:MAG TPA: hypothetical protein VFQ96_03945 [Microbacteriaceae bacterium]|nr:hypothetical protein [Microbacteriaceae bacterium]